MGAEAGAFVHAAARSIVGEELPAGLGELSGFLSSLGVAPDAPCGLFLDLTSTAEDAADVVRKCAAAAQGHTLAPAMQYHPPAILVLFGVDNPDLAEAVAARVLPRLTGSAAAGSQPGDHHRGGDSGLHWISADWAYGIRGRWLYLTTSEELFKATLARQSEARTLRYGTGDCPASGPDEVVLLTRLDKIAAQSPDYLSLLPYCGAMMTTLSWPVPSPETAEDFRNFYAPKTGADPLITTLSIRVDRIELLSRLDLVSHPEFVQERGPATAPRLCGLVSPGGLVSGCVRWGKSALAVADGLAPFVPSEIRDSYIGSLRRVLGLFAAGESVAGVTMGTPPAIHVFSTVASSVDAGAFLNKNLERATIQGVEGAWSLKVGPLELFAALSGDVLLVSNLRDELPALCKAVQAGGGKPFYAELTPAAVHSLFSVNTAQASDWISAFGGWGMPMDTGLQAELSRWMAPIGEIRAGCTVDAGWRNQFLTVYLKP